MPDWFWYTSVCLFFVLLCWIAIKIRACVLCLAMIAATLSAVLLSRKQLDALEESLLGRKKKKDA